MSMASRDLPFHPIADIFPLMGEDVFANFVRQVEKNGIQHPITIYEGKILDGRNRALACKQIGIDCPSEEFTGDDPVSFVLNENLHRRHLTPQEKGFALVKAELFREEAKMRLQKGQKAGGQTAGRGRPKNSSPAKSQESYSPGPQGRDWAHDAGRQAGLSPRSMYQIQTIDRHGIPALVDAVKKKQIGIENAELLARTLDEEAQQQIFESTPPETVKARMQEEVKRIKEGRGKKTRKRALPIRVDSPFKDQDVVDSTLIQLKQLWMRATPDIRREFIEWVNSRETDYPMRSV